MFSYEFLMELSVDKSTKYFNKLNSFGNAFDQFSVYCFPLFIFIFTSVSTGFTAAHVIFYHAYKNLDDLILKWYENTLRRDT